VAAIVSLTTLLLGCHRGPTWWEAEQHRIDRLDAQLATRVGHPVEVHDVEFYQEGPQSIACGYFNLPGQRAAHSEVFIGTPDRVVVPDDPGFRSLEERHCGLIPAMPLEPSAL